MQTASKDLILQYGITALRFGVPRGRSQTSPAESASMPNLKVTGTEPASSRVHIRIYDAHGRLVRVAVNEELTPGYYQFEWDRMDSEGRRVAPGVYVALMTAGGFSKTSKMIVTR